MKPRGNLAFPYPVLSKFTNDYPKHAFDAVITPFGGRSEEPEGWEVHFHLNEGALLGLVERKRAQYAMEITCSDTFYRHLEKSFDDNLSISIPEGALQGKIEMKALLVCARTTTGFRSDNFNAEYGQGFSFDMQPGYILATTTYPRKFGFSQAQISSRGSGKVPPVRSVFELGSGPLSAAKGTFAVDLSGEKVAILLHPDDRDSFQKMRTHKSLSEVVLTGVYLPVVMEVLREMADDSEEHRNKKWYRAIRHQLNEQGVQLEPDNCLEVAQQLLKAPFGKLLRSPLVNLIHG